MSIDQFQPNRASPSNKKARNPLDSITCITKSRRPSENSMHGSILPAVPLQKRSKIDETAPAEAHIDRHSRASPIPTFPSWRQPSNQSSWLFQVLAHQLSIAPSGTFLAATAANRPQHHSNRPIEARRHMKSIEADPLESSY